MLLSPGSLNIHLHGDLVLENGYTDVDGQRVLSVLLHLDGLLNLVLLGNLLISILLDVVEIYW